VNNTVHDDNNLGSFQVLRYLKSLIKNISPEMNDLFKNVKDFKSISFTDCTPDQTRRITEGVNNITSNYTDMVRNNKDEKKMGIS